MKIKFSASGKPLKILDAKRELKFKYQLLDDVAAKGIFSKAGSFASWTLENFQVMTATVRGIKVNWSSIMFSTLKNMVQLTKRLKGYVIQLSILLKTRAFHWM